MRVSFFIFFGALRAVAVDFKLMPDYGKAVYIDFMHRAFGYAAHFMAVHTYCIMAVAVCFKPVIQLTAVAYAFFFGYAFFGK